MALGHDEVDQAGLVGDGVAWAQVVPDDVDDRIGGWIRDQLPATGWRELTVVQPSGRRVFAAPHVDGWAVAHLAATSSGDILSADPGPFTPRPTKAARRAGLVMELDPSMVGGGPVFVTLTNRSEQLWIADPEDGGYCHAWILDSSGRRLGSSWFAFGSPQPQLTDLLPSNSLRLPVHLEEPGALGPGRHRLEAVLPSLDLFVAATVEVR